MSKFFKTFRKLLKMIVYFKGIDNVLAERG